MPVFQVSGTTFSGIIVNKTVRASEVSAALKFILLMHNSKLKKPFSIHQVSQIEDITKLPAILPFKRIPQILTEAEVVDIGSCIKSNQPVSAEKIKKFFKYFEPMIKRAVRDLWTGGVTIATHTDKEMEMYNAIVTEFLPKFSPKRGKVRSYLKSCIQKRLMRDWRKENFINAGKPSLRAKFELQREYALTIHTPIDSRIQVKEEREQLVESCVKIVKEEGLLDKMPLKHRRELMKWIVGVGLHRDFLSKKRQIQILSLVYGEEEITEVAAAKRLDISQQTLNRTKMRGESNFFRYIKNNFS